MAQTWTKRLINIGFFLLSTTIVVGGGFLALMAARGNVITPTGITGTGTIRLYISPEADLTVFLDEQQQKLTSNKTIDNVLPGEYELRIQKEGFNQWQQRVSVKEGIVTEVSSQLFPTTLPISQLTTAGIQNFTTSRTGRVIYYVTDTAAIGSNIGIWRLDLESGGLLGTNQSSTKLTNITAEIKDSIAANTYELLPSANDSKLLIKTPAGLYLLDATRYNEPSALNRLNFNYSLDSISWINDGTNLLIRSGNLLLDYDTARASTTLITYANSSSAIYTQTDNAVYYIVDKKLFKYTPTRNTAVTLENISLPDGISNLFSGNSDTSLVISAANKLYFLDISTSSLTSIGAYSLKSIAPSGKELLLTDSKQIFAAKVNISLVQNLVNVKINPTDLQELDNNLIQWAPSSVYFVFIDKKTNSLRASSSSVLTTNEVMPKLSATADIGSFKISSDSNYILIKIKDSDSTLVRDNLYKLELK